MWRLKKPEEREMGQPNGGWAVESALLGAKCSEGGANTTRRLSLCRCDGEKWWPNHRPPPLKTSNKFGAQENGG